jgi:hypothetical protein
MDFQELGDKLPINEF